MFIAHFTAVQDRHAMRKSDKRRQLSISSRMENIWCSSALFALLFFVIDTLSPVCCNSFDPMMDSNLFSIKWQGPLELDQKEIDELGERHIMITTNKKESYRCILPDTKNDDGDDIVSYKGPDIDEILKPLFSQQHCSYRIESYWTYELCHGKSLKQYHETREHGVPPKLQEYYLGFGNHRESAKTPATNSLKVKSELDEKTQKVSEETVKPPSPIPVREVDGMELPYYEVIMGEGTRCDLTGDPRRSHVLYVCQPEGRGEIYELKESSTCEYEVVVLSSLLCRHPSYRPKKTPVNEIRCHAALGSPLKPSELRRVENELRNLQLPNQDYVIPSQTSSTSSAPSSSNTGGDTNVDNEEIEQRKPKFFRKKTPEEEINVKAIQDAHSKLGTLTDKQTLRNFLTGTQCLRGGTGWWKHEVCFGKYVKQFHIEKGLETNIYLGYWNKEKHLEWLRGNQNKRPRPVTEDRKIVSQLYSDGEICDLNGKHRTCEVRLKCLSNMKNAHAVILSLAEPEVCAYVLTVESALFCSILKEADENGLFEHLEF